MSMAVEIEILKAELAGLQKRLEIVTMERDMLLERSPAPPTEVRPQVKPLEAKPETPLPASGRFGLLVVD